MHGETPKSKNISSIIKDPSTADWLKSYRGGGMVRRKGKKDSSRERTDEKSLLEVRQEAGYLLHSVDLSPYIQAPTIEAMPSESTEEHPLVKPATTQKEKYLDVWEALFVASSPELIISGGENLKSKETKPKEKSLELRVKVIESNEARAKLKKLCVEQAQEFFVESPKRVLEEASLARQAQNELKLQIEAVKETAKIEEKQALEAENQRIILRNERRRPLMEAEAKEAATALKQFKEKELKRIKLKEQEAEERRILRERALTDNQIRKDKIHERMRLKANELKGKKPVKIEADHSNELNDAIEEGRPDDSVRADEQENFIGTSEGSLKSIKSDINGAAKIDDVKDNIPVARGREPASPKPIAGSAETPKVPNSSTVGTRLDSNLASDKSGFDLPVEIVESDAEIGKDEVVKIMKTTYLSRPIESDESIGGNETQEKVPPLNHVLLVVDKGGNIIRKIIFFNYFTTVNGELWAYGKGLNAKGKAIPEEFRMLDYTGKKLVPAIKINDPSKDITSHLTLVEDKPIGIRGIFKEAGKLLRKATIRDILRAEPEPTDAGDIDLTDHSNATLPNSVLRALGIPGIKEEEETRGQLHSIEVKRDTKLDLWLADNGILAPILSSGVESSNEQPTSLPGEAMEDYTAKGPDHLRSSGSRTRMWINEGNNDSGTSNAAE